jgi:hypothetical protein
LRNARHLLNVFQFQTIPSGKIKVLPPAADLSEQRKFFGGGANMGITPITNLTPLSVARAIQADLDPLPMQRVENSPRTGDETYSPSNGKSARGSADDASDGEAAEDDLDEIASEFSEEAASPSSETGQPGSISFFA